VEDGGCKRARRESKRWSCRGKKKKKKSLAFLRIEGKKKKKKEKKLGKRESSSPVFVILSAPRIYILNSLYQRSHIDSLCTLDLTKKESKRRKTQTFQQRLEQKKTKNNGRSSIEQAAAGPLSRRSAARGGSRCPSHCGAGARLPQQELRELV